MLLGGRGASAITVTQVVELKHWNPGAWWMHSTTAARMRLTVVEGTRSTVAEGTHLMMDERIRLTEAS